STDPSGCARNRQNLASPPKVEAQSVALINQRVSATSAKAPGNASLLSSPCAISRSENSCPPAFGYDGTASMRRAVVPPSSLWRARMRSAPFSESVSTEVIHGHPRLGLKIRGSLSELTSASVFGPHRRSASRVRTPEPGG